MSMLKIRMKGQILQYKQTRRNGNGLRYQFNPGLTGDTEAFDHAVNPSVQTKHDPSSYIRFDD